MPTLRCTVRSCGEALAEEARGAACSRGHRFDRAREGYLSLLQPQDRRSARPGDEREVARARRRLVEHGHDRALTAALLEILGPAPASGGALLDVGCGEGSLATALAAATGLEAAGVDLSAPSVALAARAAPQLQWVVANADRGLPWVDRSFGWVLSVVARLPGPEIVRVLAPGGRLVVADAGDRDLSEVRQLVLGEVHGKARLERAIERLGDGFELLSTRTVRSTLALDREGVADLLRASYLGGRRARAERLAELAQLERLEVTIERDVAVLGSPRRQACRNPHSRS